MTNSNQAAWAAEIWENLIQDEQERELRIYFETEKEAMIARFALYNARTVQKRLSKEIYSKSDPEYGTTIWDKYRIRLFPLGQQFVLEFSKHAKIPFSKMTMEFVEKKREG